MTSTRNNPNKDLIVNAPSSPEVVGAETSEHHYTPRIESLTAEIQKLRQRLDGMEEIANERLDTFDADGMVESRSAVKSEATSASLDSRSTREKRLHFEDDFVRRDTSTDSNSTVNYAASLLVPPGPVEPVRLSSKRSSTTKSSMGSRSGHRDSAQSSIFDVWEGGSPSYGTMTNSMQSTLIQELMMKKRYTILAQVGIARQISLPIRILGTALAFVTVIFLWETTDISLLVLFKAIEVRLIAYLVISLVSAMCIALSHQWIVLAASSLVPSFAYALSTLFTAIGSWGVIKTAVEILVPKKKLVFCYAIGGFFSLVATIIYALQTQHNVLLDIASCATTLGLHDDIVQDSEDDAESG